MVLTPREQCEKQEDSHLPVAVMSPELLQEDELTFRSAIHRVGLNRETPSDEEQHEDGKREEEGGEKPHAVTWPRHLH
jgi:hypothetical protein